MPHPVVGGTRIGVELQRLVALIDGLIVLMGIAIQMGKLLHLCPALAVTIGEQSTRESEIRRGGGTA
jgi:hypothetical protein